MPIAALILSLLVLAGPSHAAAAGEATARALAAPAPMNLAVAFDDRSFGDWEEDDRDNVAPRDDRDESYGDDDQDDSAHAPDDDDDGWDLDPYERTERA